jgi:sulfite reductase beta subunit-like hemoprotein
MSQDGVTDFQKLRIDGVYQMNAAGDLMLRVKIPAGVLSAEQALVVAEVADRFAGGRLHLTTRGSMELHRLRAEQLPEVSRSLARVGLTSRGACGGAVRGVSCSTSAAPGFHRLQGLARRLHRHFTGNPHFEGLPKKFKIAVEAGEQGGRHLIQDVGLVLREEGGEARYDVWIAGGLGREPRPAFRYREDVPEGELIPLIEAVIRAYRAHAPVPRRLKYLAALHGEEGLRRLIERERQGLPVVVSPPGIEGGLTSSPGAGLVTVPIFAGELGTGDLRRLAAVARDAGDGFLVVTSDQDLGLVAADAAGRSRLEAALAAAGFPLPEEEETVFRICPGSQECRMGLSPTRHIARQVLERLTPEGRRLTWAISGCGNSCSQPQLADVGIVTSRLTTADDGGKEPRFTLLRRSGPGLGTAVAEGLSLQQLLQEVADIS